MQASAEKKPGKCVRMVSCFCGYGTAKGQEDRVSFPTASSFRAAWPMYALWSLRLLYEISFDQKWWPIVWRRKGIGPFDLTST